MVIFQSADLFNSLRKLGVAPTDTVMIHSSYKAIGPFDGGPTGFIQSLMTYFSEGLLVLPTHTWSTINGHNPLFDPLKERACVGILPNTFMAQPTVYRSLHPTHSVAAYGRDAQAYLAGEEMIDSPCGRKGCWGKLLDRQAKLIFIGATLKTNTFVHGVEEWHQIPNRLTIERELLQLKVASTIILSPQHRHIGDVSQNYDKLYAPLKARNAIQEGLIGNAPTLVLAATDVYDYVSTLLSLEPDVFANKQPIPSEWY